MFWRRRMVLLKYIMSLTYNAARSFTVSHGNVKMPNAILVNAKGTVNARVGTEEGNMNRGVYVTLTDLTSRY